MDKVFFHKRQVLRSYALAGYQVYFGVEAVFQRMGYPDVVKTVNAGVEIHEYVNIAITPCPAGRALIY